MEKSKDTNQIDASGITYGPFGTTRICRAKPEWLARAEASYDRGTMRRTVELMAKSGVLVKVAAILVILTIFGGETKIRTQTDPTFPGPPDCIKNTKA